MHPKAQITDDIKVAMKAGDKTKRDILRQMSAAFKQAEIDNQKELSETDAHKILQKEIKRRQESIDELVNAGRDASDVEAEVEVIAEYLPKQLTREEIETLVKAAIAETGASEPKDMGKVMGKIKDDIAGKADGKMVSQIVRELLSE